MIPRKNICQNSQNCGSRTLDLTWIPNSGLARALRAVTSWKAKRPCHQLRRSAHVLSRKYDETDNLCTGGVAVRLWDIPLICLSCACTPTTLRCDLESQKSSQYSVDYSTGWWGSGVREGQYLYPWPLHLPFVYQVTTFTNNLHCSLSAIQSHC